MTSPLRNLTKVEVYVSCVLSSDVEKTWQLARDFGNAPWWNKAGVGEFEVHRMVSEIFPPRLKLAFLSQDIV